MAKRIITSLVGLIVFFAVIYAGNPIFTVTICIVTIGMLTELYKTIKSNTELTVVGYASALLLLASIIFGSVSLEVATLASICVYLAVMVKLHTTVTYKDVGAHALLTFFITTFFGTMIRIYNDFGVYAVILVFICAWTTDTGAYFTGKAFGRHKLIPKVSPKKTVEGAFGGVITASLCCLLYLFILNSLEITHMSDLGYISIFILGVCASLFSQLGDLGASSIKRDCAAKDFGNILPGHGGILDRFDSVIYITPVIYYFLAVVAK